MTKERIKNRKIFLSYNSFELASVEAIRKKLEARGIQSWLDTINISSGKPWQEELEQAIKESDVVLVFIGNSGIGPWHNEEIRIFIKKRITNPAFTLIPIILPSTEKEVKSRLPELLTRLNIIEFEETLDEELAFEKLVSAIIQETPTAATWQPERYKESFKKDVQRVYKLLDATICDDSKFHWKSDFIARFKKGPFQFDVYVFCLENEKNGWVLEAQAKDVFIRILEVRKEIIFNKAVILSNSQFNEKAVAFCKKNDIEFLTIEDLYNQLVDFSEYVNRSIADYEGSSLYKYYVPQTGSDVEDYESIELNNYEKYLHAPLDEYIDELFRKNAKARIAILGNFGIGKTSFCLNYHYILLKRYKNDHKNRIPIYLNLREFRAGLDIQQVLVNHLQRQPNVDISLELFVELQRMGRFIFILDSLDEMSTKVDRVVLNENLREIDRLFQEGDNLYLISCRTHFFHERITDEVLEDYNVAFITEWGEKELKEYLEKRFCEKANWYLNKLNSIPALNELAKNPMLLEMIVKSLSELPDDVEINGTVLHETYTSNWINQQSKRRGSVMSKEQRQQFVLELAAMLYANNLSEIHYKELHSLAARVSGYIDLTRVDYFDTDARTSTFITKNSLGFYSFSHRSFMEFFSAKAIVSDIEKGIAGLMSVKRIPNEILNFIKELEIKGDGIEHLSNWSIQLSEHVLSENCVAILRLKKVALPEEVAKHYSINNSEWNLFQKATVEDDHRALEEMFQTYYKYLFTQGTRYTSLHGYGFSSEDIEDVIQETFLSLWVNKNKTPLREYNLKSYLLKLFKSKLSERERISTLGVVSLNDSFGAKLSVSESQFIDYESVLQKMIGKLPKENRELLTDIYLKGESEVHLADKYKMHPATIRNIKYRSLKSLRFLAKHDPEFREVRFS